MVLARRLPAAPHLFLGLALLLAPGAPHADDVGEDERDPKGFLASIRTPETFQAFLSATIEELRASDARLRRQKIRVSVIDIPNIGAPERAHWNGDSPVYPASVPKFVYLMAAFAWRDQGRLEIDPAFDRQLRDMTYQSSNRATQRVVRRLTDTEAGPRLGPAEYHDFRERRHRVKRWLQGMGVEGLHTVHPTYDGGGDLYGRDLQFLEDETVEGCLPDRTGPYKNRQAMTSNGTAQLLALLAEDLALSPASSAEVRERMRRDTRKQPYLAHRIAGGGDRRPDLEVFSKTGTWGPIFADAGILRHASGHQLVIAAFVEGKPAYRGSFIAKLTRRLVQRVLPEPARQAKAGAGGG